MNQTDYSADQRHLRERLGELSDELCGPVAGFARMRREALKDGALDGRVKELMAVAISISIRCEGCIGLHTREALEAGATREEVLEAIGVALLMSGGPGAVYAAYALDALEQFETIEPQQEIPPVPESNCE